MTQRDLAARAGVTQQTVARAELGQQAPRPSTVAKLAAALGVQPATLMRARRD